MSRLALISRTLGKVPSALIGLVYLGAIPLFACLFQRMPGAFYHSTIQLEPAYIAEQASIGTELKKSLVAALDYVNVQHNVNSKQIWRLKENDVVLYDLVATPEGMVRFSLSGTFYGPRNPVMTRVHIEFSPWQAEPYTLKNPNFAMLPACYADYDYEKEHHEYEPEVSDLLPYRKDLSDEKTDAFIMTTPDCGGLLTISRPLLQRMQAYSLASQGLAGHSPGSFGRMLYLSAVTITTTGFGDVVPLTAKARAAVASEAIFGVVLVGLFLNALAHEITVAGKLE